MNRETYLNHPTFGLLYRLCQLENDQELFTTLYAQRLFFLVIPSPNGVRFESLTRADAKLAVDNRLRQLRRLGQVDEWQKIQAIHKNTF